MPRPPHLKPKAGDVRVQARLAPDARHVPHPHPLVHHSSAAAILAEDAVRHVLAQQLAVVRRRRRLVRPQPREALLEVFNALDGARRALRHVAAARAQIAQQLPVGEVVRAEAGGRRVEAHQLEDRRLQRRQLRLLLRAHDVLQRRVAHLRPRPLDLVGQAGSAGSYPARRRCPGELGGGRSRPGHVHFTRIGANSAEFAGGARARVHHLAREIATVAV